MTPIAPALAILLLAAPAHAQPCRRAHALAAGQAAPCAGELLPSPTLDALLTAQDLARRLRVQIDEDAAVAAAALTEARAQGDAALTEAQAQRDAAVTARAADVAAVTRAATARLAAADAHVAALEAQVRATVAPVHWTWTRVLGVVLAAGVAVAAGVPCARGEAGWCAVSGLGAGVGVGLAF